MPFLPLQKVLGSRPRASSRSGAASAGPLDGDGAASAGPLDGDGAASAGPLDGEGNS